MIPVREVAPRAVGALLRKQPLSAAKVRFAWRVSVGLPMARATSVNLKKDGTLHVSANGKHWRQEIARSVPVIKGRLSELLGPHVVKQLDIKGGS